MIGEFYLKGEDGRGGGGCVGDKMEGGVGRLEDE